MASADDVLRAVEQLKDEVLDRLGVMDIRLDAIAKGAVTEQGAIAAFAEMRKAVIDRLDTLRVENLAAASSPKQAAGGAPVFPNYGRAKNAPIAGASFQDLEYYANGARRSLADPAKSRWHDKERALLAAIEAELARQNGASNSQAPIADEDVPF